MNLFAKNLEYLRRVKGKTQGEVATALGYKQSSRWSNYETGTSFPSFEGLMDIFKYFDIGATEILLMDLENVHLNQKENKSKIGKNVHPNVHPSVHLNPEKQYIIPELKVNIIADEGGKKVRLGLIYPFTDITVAAGSGIYNADYTDNVEHFTLPPNLFRKKGTRLTVRAKGPSMAPTIYDGNLIFIRLLDPSEWLKMPDGYVYVVADKDGKAYLKRVKNRFKSGFIVLTSDNPDKANFPNFNLNEDEINTIWEVELNGAFRMPNIHDTYYSKMQELEEKVDTMMHKMKLINPK